MKANHRRTAKQNARKLDKMINHMYQVPSNIKQQKKVSRKSSLL